MDIQMPVLDGAEATSLLREAGYGGPIVALTANVGRQDVALYRRAGCTDCLAKPIDKTRLYEALEAHLTAGVERRAAAGQDTAEVLDSLSREFREALPQALKDMEAALAQALDSGDWTALRRRSHSLKGIAATFGYPQLTRLAQPVEGLVEAGQLGEAERQARALIDALGDALGDAPSGALKDAQNDARADAPGQAGHGTAERTRPGARGDAPACEALP
jgi:FixJ family two-component response regulator